MHLREYTAVLRRRWKTVVVIVLAVVAVAGLYGWQSTPVYRSTTTLFVSTADDNATTAYQGTLYSAQRVKSYAALATGRDMATRVVKELGLEQTTPAELADSVSATIVPDTVLLRLSVSATRPQTAQQIAATLADELVARVKQLETPPGASGPIVTASVIEPADLPGAPYAPNLPAILLLALILGTVLGVVVAFVRDVLDNSISAPEDVAKVTEAPVIGGVPFDASAVPEPTLHEAGSSPRGEAFRIIRTSLQFLDVDQRRKVILVTSSVPEEGKTAVALNVAEAFAQSGSSVLLVDADLRRPQVAERLNLEKAVGLTTALIADQPFADFVQPAADLGVDVLASGPLPPNPSEILHTDAMTTLISQARSAYDVVVIDAPPLLPVTDASIIASLVDGAVVVVRAGKTTTSVLSNALARLSSVDARVFGIVLNMVRLSRREGYGYDYGYDADETQPTRPAQVPAQPTA